MNLLELKQRLDSALNAGVSPSTKVQFQEAGGPVYDVKGVAFEEDALVLKEYLPRT